MDKLWLILNISVIVAKKYIVIVCHAKFVTM
jgi:hypothetical protein